MQKLAVFLVVLFICSTVLCVQVEEDEQLDPFDMINFDHLNMRMRKKIEADEKSVQGQPTSEQNEDLPQSPAKKHQGSGGDSPKEDKVSEPAREQTPPKESKIPESVPASDQEQKCEAGRSCPALSLFQQFVSRLLRFVGGKVSQVDADVPTDLCLRLRLTSYQVDMLENFKRDHGKDNVFSAHDILNEAVQGAHVLNADDPSLRYLWVEEYFGVSLEKALQVLSFLTCVVVLAVLVPKIRWMWLLISAFLVSVVMTWYRLYKSEVAKQHQALMKDMPAGCGGRPDQDHSFLSTIASYVKSQVTFQEDACTVYYERLITDPSVMVTPMEALAVALVQTMLKPLRTIGTEFSEFLRALVKDLPVQWQFFSVIIVFSLFILSLLLICGYRLRIPWLLSIEPSHSDRAIEIKALEEKISHLQAAIRNTDSVQQPPHQVCDTVGSLPLEARGAATVTGAVAGVRERVPTDTATTYRPCSQPPRRAQASAEELVSRGSYQPTEEEQTDVKQVVFEDGDDFHVPCDRTFTKTVKTGKTTVEKMVVPTELRSSYQNKVDRSTSSPNQANTDACKSSPLVDVGCSQSVAETLGAVDGVGQSGDADAAKPISVARD